MTGWAAKRFWKAAEVQALEDGFGVALDGRGVRTPAKAPLRVPSRAMAEAIAAEWDAQEGTIDPLSMPVTRGANAALDKVTHQHAEVAAMLGAYGDSDLLCYRADAPAELVARQAAGWDALLDWAAARYGARLQPRVGVMHAPQDADAVAALAAELHGLTAFELTALHDLVSISGSLVLGLAVAEDRLEADTAWTLSRIDETWQQEQWGEDDEALRMAAEKRVDFLRAKVFLDLCRS